MKIYLDKISELAAKINRKVTIMEVCGGHTNVIMKYGIRDILPANVNLISGPGCPVCVTSQRDIDCMVALAQAGIPVATYGDMLHVPGSNSSLEKEKAQGRDIEVIFSATEMFKPENKDRVFFGIGFETTTPMTAAMLDRGITVFSAHKVMPAPMKFLVETSDIDGFIDPGHVSCITGEKMWHELEVPQVICGFQKGQIVRGICKLLELIAEGRNEVVNDYDEVVSFEGNQKAQAMIKKNMKSYDAEWRGIGAVAGSGLEPRDDKLNARIRFADILQNVNESKPTACRCGEILQGKCEPKDCPLFGKGCTPKNPMGACMVSSDEGACGIAYKYLTT